MLSFWKKITQGQQWVCLHSNTGKTGNKHMVTSCDLSSVFFKQFLRYRSFLAPLTLTSSATVVFLIQFFLFPDSQPHINTHMNQPSFIYFACSESVQADSAFTQNPSILQITDYKALSSRCLLTRDKTVGILLSTEAVCPYVQPFSFLAK